MTNKKITVYKPRPISGFPEWIPEVRLVEQAWIEEIEKTFKSFGFCSIETPTVEEIDVIAAKGGDTDKEIYTLSRLNTDKSDKSDARLALHYDLTVPLARYVAQHYNDLVFPFKRYQIQKNWRGERPQEGRYREFYQCDIDIIDNNNVSLHFDAELPAIIYDILEKLQVGNVSLHINNRKILEGFYTGLGITNIVSAIRIADKIDKIGGDGVLSLLIDDLGIDNSVARKCISLAEIKTTDTSFANKVKELGVENDLLDKGLDELEFVVSSLSHLPSNRIYADMSIARGFDYYTGTVYEAKFIDFPEYPTICSGGRYDNLASAYTTKKLPGVGMSIGLTRIFSKLYKENLLNIGPSSATEVLVLYPPNADRNSVISLSHSLRSRGINVEMYHEGVKLAKQIKYAEKKKIPYVLFPKGDTRKHDELKNMNTREQFSIDINKWKP